MVEAEGPWCRGSPGSRGMKADGVGAPARQCTGRLWGQAASAVLPCKHPAKSTESLVSNHPALAQVEKFRPGQQA